MLTRISLAALMSLSCSVLFAQKHKAETDNYTKNLMQDSCRFSTTGRNMFFILEPGYRLTLAGKAGDSLFVTVLNETRKIGNTETRVVEEREMENGKIDEVSRNFYAFCEQNGGIYYFGEEVDIYKDGIKVGHSGEWRADSSGATEGLMMPGLILLGARYYQEIAPGKAMDRAENISITDSLQTPAGLFRNCLRTFETTPLEPMEKEYKVYAPGIGLIKDEDLLLVKYGFVQL